MTRKTKKILVFILTFLIMLVYYCNFFEVFGTGPVSHYFPHGNNNGTKFSRSIINMILPAVRVVASGVAIIAIIIMGTRYMAGAPSERAEIKNQIITFVVGVLLVAGAVKIVGYLKDAVQI